MILKVTGSDNNAGKITILYLNTYKATFAKNMLMLYNYTL